MRGEGDRRAPVRVASGLGSTVIVPARAALAGNPSDGYGGAVTAIPLPCWGASAVIVDSAVEHPTTGSGDASGGVHGDAPGDRDHDLADLIEATRRAMVRLVGAPADVVTSASITVETTIPRSVGLAGSSAIVITVARSLGQLAPEADWSRRLLDPQVMAVLARSAEVDELGIAAGLQDRLVQAAGEPLLMDFGPDRSGEVLGHPCGSIEPLPAPPGAMLVAYRPATAEASGVVHAGLAARADTAPIMAALAEQARSAAAALHDHDLARLGAAMDRTFDLRAELLDLDPRHVEMVAAARRAGAHANYTGSGGAVVVIGDDDSVASAATALAALDGCEVVVDPLAPSHRSPTTTDDNPLR